MPNTEIDDIFSGKSSKIKRPEKVTKTASSSTQIAQDTESKKKKKKKKKAKQESGDLEGIKHEKKEESQKNTASEVAKDGKRKRVAEPEEVVDPSLQSKRRKLDKKDPSLFPKKVAKDEIAKFKDSRGSSGRKRTEEGFLIYTEEELGLNKEGGGDTPLCPFDCDCCY